MCRTVFTRRQQRLTVGSERDAVHPVVVAVEYRVGVRVIAGAGDVPELGAAVLFRGGQAASVRSEGDTPCTPPTRPPNTDSGRGRDGQTSALDGAVGYLLKATYLPTLRDAESELRSGRGSLLSRICPPRTPGPSERKAEKAPESRPFAGRPRGGRGAVRPPGPAGRCRGIRRAREGERVSHGGAGTAVQAEAGGLGERAVGRALEPEGRLAAGRHLSVVGHVARCDSS